MASLTPSLKEPRTAYGGGGGTNHRFPGGGGGGGGRGDHEHDSGERVRRYRLAMAIGLVAIFMMFLSFSVAFVLHEKLGVPDIRTGGYVRTWYPVRLPVGLLLFNTALLILSSLTLEKSRREAFQQAAVSVVAVIPGVKVSDNKRSSWLAVTLLLGLGFCVGQLAAWRNLMDRGIYLSGTPSSSFFYVATGLHGVHLFAGIIALLYAVLVVHRRQGLDRRRVTLDVTSWYWHSMTVLWVYLLFLLVVVR
ncbi:MAG: cytochrome c oxidase subunit 3 [Terriglobales bacterium]